MNVATQDSVIFCDLQGQLQVLPKPVKMSSFDMFRHFQLLQCFCNKGHETVAQTTAPFYSPRPPTYLAAEKTEAMRLASMASRFLRRAW